MLEINSQTLEILGEPLLDLPQITVKSPTIIGLVGKNGSGKTTLLEHIRSNNDDVNLIKQLKPKRDNRSGGEIAKAYLLDGLKSLSQILLLDEPTTHLDENNRDWLTEKIKRLPCIVIVTSHDRYFLDSIVNEIWAIDNGELNIYNGNYSHYKEVLNHRKTRHKEEYRQYINEKNEIKKKIERKRDQATRSNVAPGSVDHGDDGSSPYFNKLQKKLFKSAKAFEARMDRLEEVEQPEKELEVRFYHHDAARLGKKILMRYEGDIKAGGRSLISDVRLFIRNQEKIAITGNNGAGKTTLIKTLLDSHPHLRVGYFHQQLESLDINTSILENVLEDSLYDEQTARTMLSRLNIKRDKVFEQVKWISGGERIKVQLVKVLLGQCDVLVLDEPSNFLDLESLEALEDMLLRYPNTIILISHDRQFIESVTDREYRIENQSLVEQSSVENVTDDDTLLLIENKIAEVLSDMAEGSTAALDARFEALLEEKKQFINTRK